MVRTILVLAILSLSVAVLHELTHHWLRSDTHMVEVAGAAFCIGLCVAICMNRRMLEESRERERLVRELSEAQKRLERQALTDPLTGALNRRGFERALLQELALFDRHGTDFCLVILDVDHLKSINDTLGHAEGDKALIVTAQALMGTARKEDVCARIGGDEFALLLPDTRLAGAEARMERFRDRMDALANDPLSLRISVSFGIAVASEGTVDIFERADEKMYAAKARIVHHAVVTPAQRLDEMAS